MKLHQDGLSQISTGPCNEKLLVCKTHFSTSKAKAYLSGSPENSGVISSSEFYRRGHPARERR
jgi:hypothetical protein